jgi:hypothetical protein
VCLDSVKEEMSSGGALSRSLPGEGGRGKQGEGVSKIAMVVVASCG